MGNWRTVKIVGTCASAEVQAPRSALEMAHDLSNIHCLSSNYGLMGLGYWAKPVMDVQGNLAERDYSVEDVADQLRVLVKVAPSLHLVVHCGDEHESKEVVASITVEKGVVTVGAPQIETLGEPNEARIQANFFAQLAGRR